MDFDFYVGDFKSRLLDLFSDFRQRISETDLIVNGDIVLKSEQAGVEYTLSSTTVRGNTQININATEIKKVVFSNDITLNGQSMNGTIIAKVNQPIDLVAVENGSIIDLSKVNFKSSDTNVFWITLDGTNTLMPKSAGTATLSLVRPQQHIDFTIIVVEPDMEVIDGI